MSDFRDPERIALLAPVVLVAHVVEEAPSFVPWMNAHVDPPISDGLFWTVNLMALVVTLVLAAAVFSGRTSGPALAMMAWLGLLMLANSLFHIAATVVDEAYAPGVVTAVVLYLPYWLWFTRRASVAFEIHPAAALAATLVGALPMLAHGYLIVFEGRRLF